MRDPREIEARLAAAAGDKYSHRELKDYADLMKRTLPAVPAVAKVDVAGVLPEQVYLDYSQERLASYGIQHRPALRPSGGAQHHPPRRRARDRRQEHAHRPSGEFRSEREIGDVLVPTASGQGAVYLRDVADVVRAYQSPARYLNFLPRRAHDGTWPRTRAVTLSIQMRAGRADRPVRRAVDAALDDLKQRLPEDLILARTSDQPLQVEENIHLFMASLYEAIALVVLVSLIGFWEWRSALLMALSIPHHPRHDVRHDAHARASTCSRSRSRR